MQSYRDCPPDETASQLPKRASRTRKHASAFAFLPDFRQSRTMHKETDLWMDAKKREY